MSFRTFLHRSRDALDQAEKPRRRVKKRKRRNAPIVQPRSGRSPAVRQPHPLLSSAAPRAPVPVGVLPPPPPVAWLPPTPPLPPIAGLAAVPPLPFAPEPPEPAAAVG